MFIGHFGVGFGAKHLAPRASLRTLFLVEVPVFLLGVWLYTRCTIAADARGRWGLWSLVVALLAIHAANLFGGPPPGVAAIAWAGQLQWLLVLWAWWVDRHRRAKIIITPAACATDRT